MKELRYVISCKKVLLYGYIRALSICLGFVTDITTWSWPQASTYALRLLPTDFLDNIAHFFEALQSHWCKVAFNLFLFNRESGREPRSGIELSQLCPPGWTEYSTLPLCYRSYWRKETKLQLVYCQKDITWRRSARLIGQFLFYVGSNPQGEALRFTSAYCSENYSETPSVVGCADFSYFVGVSVLLRTLNKALSQFFFLLDSKVIFVTTYI